MKANLTNNLAMVQEILKSLNTTFKWIQVYEEVVIFHAYNTRGKVVNINNFLMLWKGIIKEVETEITEDNYLKYEFLYKDTPIRILMDSI